MTTRVVYNWGYQMAKTIGSLPISPVQGLVELGFSEYEARAYIELLRESPRGAYELAKDSGVPSSKIYQALARLVDRQAAIPIMEDGKTRYVPIDPKELLALRRLRVDQQLETLETQLLEESRDGKLSYIWNINEYHSLHDQLRLMIRETQRELVLSCWPEDIIGLAPELTALAKTNAKIAIVLFGAGTLGQDLESQIAIYHHPIEDTIYAERGGRGLTMVSDGNRALVATIVADQKLEGAWSMNRGFVLLAEDYVKHDIYLMKIVARMDRQLEAAFGERYRLLRNVFADNDLN